MFDMNKDILPVGSVVLLKKGKLRLMIVGLFPLMEDGVSYYDYCACLYPEGIVSTKTMGFFNRESIERVYSLGGFDDSANTFMNVIKEQEKQFTKSGKYKRIEIDQLDNIFPDDKK